MHELIYLAAVFFLPLFPFSLLFNALFERLPNQWLRLVLLLVWPQMGLALLYFSSAHTSLPASWIAPWALFTAALYAFRLLSLREMNRWISLLATSTWVLLWIPLLGGIGEQTLHLYALWFSAPLALLVLMAGRLQQCFGAAYTGLYAGLAHTIPRFSGVMVFAILAAIATPLFPAFFAMLGIILQAKPGIVFGLVGVWLLWSWAGARLIQGMLIGQARHTDEIADLSVPLTWLYAMLLADLMIAGVYLTGGLA